MRHLATFIFCLLCIQNIWSQSVQQNIGGAPTNFQSRIPNQTWQSFDQEISETPSLQIQDYGGNTKLQLMNIRGADSASLAVELEGIPISTASESYFNLGYLDTFGLSDFNLVRGGYNPLSTSPAGILQLQFDDSPVYKTSAYWGSYQRFGIAQKTPNAAASIRYGKNDFLYYDGTEFRRRKNNSGINFNVRAWHKTEKQKAWIQFFLSDQDNPSSLSGFSENSTFVYRPIAAFQQKIGAVSLDLWASFQDLDYEDSNIATNSQDFYTGERISWKSKITKELVYDLRAEQTQAQILDQSPFRHSSSLSQSLLWFIDEGQILHPRLRIEYLSDLNSAFSLHPGVGGSHLVKRWLQILWNADLISRAPSLLERYSTIPGIQSNPKLKRQSTYQSDIGFELRAHQIFWQQTFYFNFTKDILQYDFQTNQTRNFEDTTNYGTETQIAWNLSKQFDFTGSYTFLHSKQAGHSQYYRAKHRVGIKPQWKPNSQFEFKLPIQFKSSVLTPSSTRISDQWNLGIQSVYRHEKMQLNLEVNNLLAWHRKEVEAYPLEQETYWKLSCQYTY